MKFSTAVISILICFNYVSPQLINNKGYKCFPQTGIQALVRLNILTQQIECLSNDGVDCIWGLDSFTKCQTALNTFPSAVPLTCGTPLSKVANTFGYGDPSHWCEIASSWYFEQWHCSSETGINIPIRINRWSKNIECMSTDGVNCIANNDEVCAVPNVVSSSTAVVKTVPCGNYYLRSHPNTNPYLYPTDHFCKSGLGFFYGTGEWICGGDFGYPNTPFRIGSNGDIECFSLNAYNCAWHYGTGQVCRDYINANNKNVAPLTCGPNHTVKYGIPGYTSYNWTHWCYLGRVFTSKAFIDAV